MLALEQCRPHRRPGSHARGARCGRLGAQFITDLALIEPYLLVILRVDCKAHAHALGQRRVRTDIFAAQAGQVARDGYEPIERTAVEQMPAAAAGQQARDRAFARAARSVDRDDRRVIRGGLLQDQSCKDRPTLRASAGKPGKEVATFATSSISMLCCAITLAIAKAIAMR